MERTVFNAFRVLARFALGGSLSVRYPRRWLAEPNRPAWFYGSSWERVRNAHERVPVPSVRKRCPAGVVGVLSSAFVTNALRRAASTPHAPVLSARAARPRWLSLSTSSVRRAPAFGGGRGAAAGNPVFQPHTSFNPNDDRRPGARFKKKKKKSKKYSSCVRVYMYAHKPTHTHEL